MNVDPALVEAVVEHLHLPSDPKPSRKRTGVIVGVGDIEEADGRAVAEQLQSLFPGVRFAVIPGPSSVAFEYDHVDDEDE